MVLDNSGFGVGSVDVEGLLTWLGLNVVVGKVVDNVVVDGLLCKVGITLIRLVVLMLLIRPCDCCSPVGSAKSEFFNGNCCESWGGVGNNIVCGLFIAVIVVVCNKLIRDGLDNNDCGGGGNCTTELG